MKKPKIKISEHDIQKLIIEYLKYRKDIYFIRNNAFQGFIKRPNGTSGYIKNDKKGSPDIIILYKGRWIGAEIKALHGHQLPDQKQAEADIRRCGGEYYIIRSLEDLIEIL